MAATSFTIPLPAELRERLSEYLVGKRTGKITLNVAQGVVTSATFEDGWRRKDSATP